MQLLSNSLSVTWNYRQTDAVGLLAKTCSALTYVGKQRTCFILGHWTAFSWARKYKIVIHCFIMKNCFPGLLFMPLAQVSLNFSCCKQLMESHTGGVVPRVSYFKHSGCIPSVDEILGLISTIKKKTAPYLQRSVKKGKYCSERSCYCAFFFYIHR